MGEEPESQVGGQERGGRLTRKPALTLGTLVGGFL